MALLTGNFEDGADVGADAVLAGGGVGSGGTLEAEPIGDGDGGVAEGSGTRDHGLGETGSVEEGEGRAGVEFDKGQGVGMSEGLKVEGLMSSCLGGARDWGGCGRGGGGGGF